MDSRHEQRTSSIDSHEGIDFVGGFGIEERTGHLESARSTVTLESKISLGPTDINDLSQTMT